MRLEYLANQKHLGGIKSRFQQPGDQHLILRRVFGQQEQGSTSLVLAPQPHGFEPRIIVLWMYLPVPNASSAMRSSLPPSARPLHAAKLLPK